MDRFANEHEWLGIKPNVTHKLYCHLGVRENNQVHKIDYNNNNNGTSSGNIK